MELLIAAIVGFAVTAVLIRITIQICTVKSWVAKPRRDRWHRGAPCLFGGIPLWAGFVLVSAVFVRDALTWALIALSSTMFLLGFVDDVLRLRPRAKLVAQILAAIALVAVGVVYPVSSNLLLCWTFSILWVVGITNAFNLLDNMDGLAAGIALIATIYTAAFYYLQGESQYSLVLAIFAGALAGFLVFNFNPARIFMGDTGSLAIGFFLGSTTLLRVVHLSNVTAFVFVPVLLLAVPLFDTFFVSVTRRLRGQPVSQGGTDHSSHRFVKLGLDERKAVLLMYGICGISGGVALVVRTLLYHQAIALIMAWFFVLFVFGVHLFQPQPDHIVKEDAVPGVVRRLGTRDVLALLLDPAALGIAYYLSYTFRFRPSAHDWTLFYSSLPIIVAIKFGVLYASGTYRRSWWRGSFFDLWGIARGIALGDLISIAVLAGIYRFTGYSRTVFLIDGIFSWTLLLGTRGSFKLFQQVLYAAKSPARGRTVFLVGTSEPNQLALQFLRLSGIHCAGLIDSSGGADLGRRVWGVPVLGRIEDLSRLATQHKVSEVVATDWEQAALSCELESLCNRWGLSLKILGLRPAGSVDDVSLVIKTVLADGRAEVPNWAVQAGGQA